MLYLCDNLATLEYKLQEEIMTVVHLLSAVLSNATNLISLLEGAVLEAGKEEIGGTMLPSRAVSDTSCGGDTSCEWDFMSMGV